MPLSQRVIAYIQVCN